MLRIMQAHGLDAGPTQRPLVAGGLAGLMASAPAAALLALFGSLDALALAVKSSPMLAALAFAAAMLIAGALYGALFQRAANDALGCWLFGLAFGFAVWMVALVPLVQWMPNRPAAVGAPAIGLLLGQLFWGLLVGFLFPMVHRLFRVDIANRPGFAWPHTGPEAAAVPARRPQPARSRRP